jgi:isoquinoline 1-oxidoreductase beta subunit
MPLIVADEMEADWTKVKVAQATGNEVKYGNQDTDGSRSTRHFFMPMRQVGAAARMMLEAAAAKRWGVDVSDVEAKNHEIIQKSTGKKLGYGDLAADASTMGVPSNVSVEKSGSATPVSLPLKDPSEFRYIGKEGPISSTASTSRPVAPFMVRTSACPGRNMPSLRARR